MNRRLSTRSGGNSGSSHQFNLSTLRGLQQPKLSQKMSKLIKNENGVISAYEKAGRERISVASQLSDWGDSIEDDAISDVSDKLAVLLAEMGDQEDNFAGNLEEYRMMLKHIRDTEASVQPARNQRNKAADEVQKMKLKDPNNSSKIETLEQELVRAEAQALVAEAQLTNMTRQKLKESFDVHLAAVIERGEKQILLARHARRLLNCLDDTPIIPGEEKPEYRHGTSAKLIVEDAERDLKSWSSSLEPILTAVPDRTSESQLPLSSAARRKRDSAAAGASAGRGTESMSPTANTAAAGAAGYSGLDTSAGVDQDMTDAEPVVTGVGAVPEATTTQAPRVIMRERETEVIGTTGVAGPGPDMMAADQGIRVTGVDQDRVTGTDEKMRVTDADEAEDQKSDVVTLSDSTESVIEEEPVRERPEKVPKLSAGLGMPSRAEPSAYTVAVPY
ncbi:hypothetical protein P168DRAFT_177327 [Aspergillus campestris IBT 28561]|uniref:Eisosome component PIL1-domain-containing protein n=1 Tax=Aspergillus campestris (strain IBT 28561) TaxID=1392248 RepID=A0A2I1CZQ5_ASPC2|nr:uncharacterized protein P168DRAFT_177327 [Aspergillus campestris IBT 28561]PKY03112.1 hypothetical protein P168DRAFT_177327 [Aspergillus campestris IBT 28561]